MPHLATTNNAVLTSFANRSFVFWCTFVTFFARESVTQHRVPAVFGGDPQAGHPWRVVTNVLIVAAAELRDPVTFLIGVIANDRLLHRQGRWHAGIFVAPTFVKSIRDVPLEGQYDGFGGDFLEQLDSGQRLDP